MDLSKNNLTDISKISEFYKLNDLDLSENKNIKDLSPITELQSLCWLKLNNCELTDVSGLAEITASNVDFNMDSVQVELNNNNITDISVLENANIQILLLNGNKNITKIGNLKNVTVLELSNCDIEDISKEEQNDDTNNDRIEDKTEKAEDDETENIDETNKTQKEEKTEDVDKTEKKKDTNNSIKTGDNIAIFAGIILIATVILVVVFVKKKNNKNN